MDLLPIEVDIAKPSTEAFKPPSHPPLVVPPPITHEIEGFALSFQEGGVSLPTLSDSRMPTGQNIDLIPMSGDDSAAAPAEDTPLQDEESAEEDTDAARHQASTVALPAPPPSGPAVPPIPHVPSRAERNCLYDELNKKQIRTSEDVQQAMRFFIDARRMDEGELANIRLRVLKWAEDQSGGQNDLREQITLLEAATRPVYIIKLIMRTTRGDEAPRSQTLDHPGGAVVQDKLGPEDYRLVLHLSADTINEKLLEMTPQPPLRCAGEYVAHCPPRVRRTNSARRCPHLPRQCDYGVLPLRRAQLPPVHARQQPARCSHGGTVHAHPPGTHQALLRSWTENRSTPV